jgi:hypothetical protein
MDINYYTCTELAQDYGISVAKFFKLNPKVLPDCSNIQANTDYCVAGCECLTFLIQRTPDSRLTVESSKQSSSRSGPTTGCVARLMAVPHVWAQQCSAATPRPGPVATRRKFIHVIIADLC